MKTVSYNIVFFKEPENLVSIVSGQLPPSQFAVMSTANIPFSHMLKPVSRSERIDTMIY